MHGAWYRLSDLTDLKFFKENLNGTLFPDVPDAVEVHNGFGSEHAKTAATILAETQKLIAANGATQVLVVRPISLFASLLSPRVGGPSLSGARPPLSYSEGLRARLPGGQLPAHRRGPSHAGRLQIDLPTLASLTDRLR